MYLSSPHLLVPRKIPDARSWRSFYLSYAFLTEPPLGVSIIDTVYRLSEPSEKAEYDRKVEDWGAKCYQATVELVDPPRVLTEEMLRDYLARFMEHVEVDDEEYARQRFVDVFQIGWNIEREYWEEDA